MLNLDELKKHNKEREKLKLEPYKLIFDMVCTKIKESSTILGHTHCLYQIPEFILGYTTYDVNDCSKWLINKLNKLGFNNIECYENNIILIIWSNK
jgi:hypothetical protein